MSKRIDCDSFWCLRCSMIFSLTIIHLKMNAVRCKDDRATNLWNSRAKGKKIWKKFEFLLPGNENCVNFSFLSRFSTEKSPKNIFLFISSNFRTLFRSRNQSKIIFRKTGKTRTVKEKHLQLCFVWQFQRKYFSVVTNASMETHSTAISLNDVTEKQIYEKTTKKES